MSLCSRSQAQDYPLSITATVSQPIICTYCDEFKTESSRHSEVRDRVHWWIGQGHFKSSFPEWLGLGGMF